VNFGAALKSAREEAGLLQAQLAEKADLNSTYLSQLENNRKSPTLATYFRLCGVLGIKPSVLMKRVEEAASPTPATSKRRKRNSSN
jgi:transcriptional regulator with XRE-family HTH domain